MKKCKQCGEVLPENLFRPYTSRSNGIRRSKTGYNTVCLQCESLNARLSAVYKKASRSPEDERALELGATYYKQLRARGLQPIGAYAKHVLGIGYSGSNTTKPSMAESLVDQLGPKTTRPDKLLEEFQKLLALELTDIPDVYQEMLSSLQEQCLDQDRHVAQQYRDIYNQVATRFDEYEDNYKW